MFLGKLFGCKKELMEKQRIFFSCFYFLICFFLYFFLSLLCLVQIMFEGYIKNMFSNALSLCIFGLFATF